MNRRPEHIFNFYLLVGDVSCPAIFKVPLDRELQQELTVHFEALRAAFRARGTEYLAYDPGYRPEAGELFEVRRFGLPASLFDLAASSQTLRALDDVTLESEHVRALVGVGMAEEGSHPLFSFQALDGRQVLRRDGWTFLLSERVFRRIDHAGLLVRNSIDALWQNGSLYFSSEYVVRRFLDLTGLFEEATTTEITRFLEHPSFAPLDQAAVLLHADQWVRRKIKMLIISGALDRVSGKRLREHARRFRIDLPLDDSRIVIPSDKKQLKVLLRLLDEDFLESALTNARFVVSSKRKFSPSVEAAIHEAEPELARRRRW